MQITGIILSGGQSKRMGTDKALIHINEKTLLDNAIDICSNFFSPILISSNHRNHEKTGYKVIPDEIINCGPMGGIYSSLKQSVTDWNFVMSVDAAFVETEFIKYIISETGDFDAIIPIHQNGKEPLIALYHKDSLAEMKKMLDLGNFKIQNLLNLINTRYVDSQDFVKRFPKLFRNLNRPEDF
ncbi:MAG TPA: molybdenum cofactor guanylyltransferase [Draconibacterium sp.]|nr:molybdenum cofactor guanylyltransferase [Draconibacterium sp.]HRX10554.1 molybdenum cofactor guanylyltransferase [Draconibacterium sp.]